MHFLKGQSTHNKMSDVSTQIVKVILSTTDRTNQNDDTSECKFCIEPVQNVQSFCIRRALLPLSSYTFSADDADSRLVITNNGQFPNGVYNTSAATGARFVSYFAKPTGVVFSSARTFNDDTKDVNVRMSWMYLPANSYISVGYQLASGPYIKHTILTNATAATVYYSHQTIVDAINNGIQTQAGFGASGVVVRCSVFGEAPQPNDTAQRVVFTQARPSAGTAYFYCDWKKPAGDPSWFGMQGFSIWLTKVGTAYDSTIGGFSILSDLTTNRISPQTLATLPGTALADGIQNTEMRTVTFLTTQAYTPAQIISTFNADPAMSGILGINLTQLAVDPAGMQTNRFFLYNNFGVGIPDYFKVGTKFFLPNKTLGYVEDNGYKLWLNTMGPFNPVHVLIAGAPPNLTPDIVVRSIAIPTTGDVMDQASFVAAVNLLTNPDGIQMENDVNYYNINQNSTSAWSGADLASLDPSNRYVYGWRFVIGQTRFDLGGVLLSNTQLTDLTYVPSYWVDRHAQMNPTTDTNTWMVNNFAYTHSKPSTQYITFPLNTVVNTANIQTALNGITAPLTATVQTQSNTILFVNGGLGNYSITANKRLGVYDDSEADSDFVITPSESRNTTHPIDLSCDNSVLFVGLNLYHDGRTSVGIGDPKAGTVRPSRKNIVASVHNTSNVVYGGHISYTNDSDNWLPSYVRDLSEMHLSVYNSSLETANLNKQDCFIEVDLKCSSYGINR